MVPFFGVIRVEALGAVVGYLFYSMPLYVLFLRVNERPLLYLRRVALICYGYKYLDLKGEKGGAA